MPTTKNLLLYAIAILVVAFIISRIPGYTLNTLSHDDDHPIVLGTNVWPGYEPLFLARNQGMLDSDTVSLLDFSSSTQVMRSFVNGTIDAAGLTLEQVLILRESNVDVVIVLVVDFSNGGDAIVARPDIDSLQALEGRPIGVPNTALGALIVARALEVNDMPPDALQRVFADMDEQEILFEQGRIDAAVTYSPVLDRLKAAGNREVFSSREIPGEIVDVIITRPHIVEHHGDKLAELLSGWFDALAYIEANPEESAQLMVPRLSVSPELVLQSLQNLQFVSLEQNLDYLGDQPGAFRDSIDSLQEIMVDAGFLVGPIDAVGLVSDRAVRAVVQQRERRQ